MNNQLPGEKSNKLLPALLPLAKCIGSGTVPEEHILQEILHSVGVETEEWAVEELVSWIKILQKASTASNDDERAAITAELQGRGIPMAPAILAIDAVYHPIAPSLIAAIAAEEASFQDEDIQVEIGRHNFVRAVMLAQQHDYPRDKVRYLQELALKKYAFEYRNYPGLRKLMREYELSEADLKRILGKGSKEIGDWKW